MRPVIDFIKNPNELAQALLRYLGTWLPDGLYLRWMYRLKMGKKLNINNPQTFNEKLQWLKLNDRKPEYTTMVDKYAVKAYVASHIGNEYIIPTIGVWNNAEEIEWDKLPDQFVLKTTHDGGNCGVIICKDKKNFDINNAITKIKQSFSHNIYKNSREWPYKNVPHRVIAEKYIEPQLGTNDLADYKFFCFDGKVMGLFVATERQNPNEEVKFDFFDAEYNHLPFRQGHDNAKVMPPKPKNFEQMKRVAAELSKGMPHVRVDFYDLGDKVLFGELTFFHFGGMVPFEPEEWDKRFGDMINLPQKE